MLNPEGRQLPPKPGVEQFPVDPRRNREMVPTQADFSRDVIGSKQSAADERVRNVQRDQYADFYRRRFGRAITEAEYPEHLRNGGVA